ncbi:MAG: hypothetical protein MI923_06300 [Phycisphaerales bacterium]|nr:hypothetical protein [Phycisphaerales bacterium]
MAQRFARLLGVLSVFALIPVGCIEPEGTSTVNTPSLDDSKEKPILAEYLAYHQDQGLLADLSIADIHFVPHSCYLSGAGEARLERYAELLASTGGTLNYDTRVRDKTLIEARLNTAKAFLAKAFPSDHDIDVISGMPGGRGMVATEAIGGQAVAREPEARGTAYNFGSAGGSSSGG